MEIRILNTTEHEKYYKQIKNMLVIADSEFVPPLSQRCSTTQADMTPNSNGGIENYFNEMKNQRFVVAVENDELLGFVSYRENHTSDDIEPDYVPNIYISTLIVSSNARGKGLTRRMYDHLFQTYSSSYILTRTWSTNIAHIKILEQYGFTTHKVLIDHRGKGIDTVYFVKNVEL